DVFAWVYFVSAQPAIRGAKHINGQRDPVKRLNESLKQKERRRCREIVFEKPPKLARQMSMPVDERIKRRQVDRAAVQPASEAIAFPDSGAVEHDPPVLLADEMKDGQVRQHAPEDQLAFRIQGPTNDPAEHRPARVERTA